MHSRVAHSELRGAAGAVTNVDLNNNIVVLLAGRHEHGLSSRGVRERASARHDAPVYSGFWEIARQHVNFKSRRPTDYRAAWVNYLVIGTLGGYRLGYALHECEAAFIGKRQATAPEHRTDTLRLVVRRGVVAFEKIRTHRLARGNRKGLRRL